ncbi:MAG: preprotein translocase subunit SecA [Myxococcota bacterium]|nr:preprotein translocase subunit SecA [Myxococcota bacterium]
MFDIKSVVGKVFGTRSDRELKKLMPLVSRVKDLEQSMKDRSDEALKALTPEFKTRIANGESLDDILPEAYALVREVSVRTLGMRPYDVQVLGGIVIHQGMVAEMKTGEGKTLAATMPVYLNALTGRGVHVITVNDYLASRDAAWMSAIYTFLGMTVGAILSSDRNPATKKIAYAADITYGTNNEFGFDYLRDNMKFRMEDYVQRPPHFAIIDEVDSILVDEARTPLIISGPASQDVEKYRIIDQVIPLLQAEIDYVVDEKSRSVNLTDAGVDQVELKLGIGNLYDQHNMEILHHVNQALKAHTLFKRDRDYVVKTGKVMIVDEHTGRLMPGRRWSDGLHQSIEAKEQLNVEPESQTYASITYQNYFRMYEKLAGMTGTALTEQEEFQKIYNLDVRAIPTNKPVVRADNDDIIYKTQVEKYRAVLDEIEESHKRGQPVLVGTVSVEKSEIVSRLLRQRGIPHEILNARNHAREAEIVTQAGRLGRVTVSTNMAGRGTDIKLGGDPEGLAKLEVDAAEQPEAFEATQERLSVQCAEEREQVLAAGGLHILGTERHESRRIDNQLRGRAGRQGDPGSSRFYLSLEDDLLRIFGSDKIIGWMEKMGLEDDEPIEHRWINRSIENAQKKVEGHNFNIRKQLLEYDDVMNLQRQSIYKMRRQALGGENIREMVLEIIEQLSDDVMDEHIDPRAHPEDWDVGGVKTAFLRIFGADWEDSEEELRDMAVDEIRSRIVTDATTLYEAKEESVGPDNLRELERMLLLQHTDQFWKDHLLAMDRLRDGIGLRGYGQRNPLLEYKREGTDMFMLMNSLRDEQVLSKLLRLEFSPDQQVPSVSKGNARRLAAGNLLGNGAAPQRPQLGQVPFAPPTPEQLAARSPGGATPPTPMAPPPGFAQKPPPPARPKKGLEAYRFAKENGLKRNAPCPCGSGQKFKKCCYKVGAAAEASQPGA